MNLQLWNKESCPSSKNQHSFFLIRPARVLRVDEGAKFFDQLDRLVGIFKRPALVQIVDPLEGVADVLFDVQYAAALIILQLLIHFPRPIRVPAARRRGYFGSLCAWIARAALPSRPC